MARLMEEEREEEERLEGKEWTIKISTALNFFYFLFFFLLIFFLSFFSNFAHFDFLPLY